MSKSGQLRVAPQEVRENSREFMKSRAQPHRGLKKLRELIEKGNQS